MLNPKRKSEHLIYGDILTPPADYPVLEKAVTTTYSLDISALVSCMIPLAFSDDVNSRLFQNKVSTLTALRNISDKLVVFFDPGQIKTLRTRNQEFAILLEKMVVPVMLEKTGEIYPAFHPKMWLLQFSNNKGEHCYRLIILSRNISYDKCYDVSLVLESDEKKHTKKGFQKTQPILEFLKYLNDTQVSNISDFQQELISNLIAEIENEMVCFKIDNQFFDEDDWEIFPIYKNTFKKDLFKKFLLSDKEGYKKLLVMSPFISDDVLSALSKSLVQKNTTDKRIKLITRQDSLDGVKAANYKDFDYYVLNSNVISGEDSKLDDNPDADQEKQSNDEYTPEEKVHDIHAKIFLTESKDKKEFFIGSANATNSAFNRNTELVVRLKSTANQMSVDSFFNDLNTDKGNMFVPAEITAKDKTDITVQKAVENALRNIAHIKANAKVIQNGDYYSVEIKFAEVPLSDGVKISISPISCKEVKPIAQNITFENLQVNSISEFYYICAEKQDTDNTVKIERLIKISTDNIPYEERDSQLVNQVITDKESFTEYVTLLLSQDSISTQMELAELKETSSKWKIINTQMPLYETLLKASVVNPQAVINLGKDLELIRNKEIVTQEFKDLYEQFKQAIKE